MARFRVCSIRNRSATLDASTKEFLYKGPFRVYQDVHPRGEGMRAARRDAGGGTAQVAGVSGAAQMAVQAGQPHAGANHSNVVRRSSPRTD